MQVSSVSFQVFPGMNDRCTENECNGPIQKKGCCQLRGAAVIPLCAGDWICNVNKNTERRRRGQLSMFSWWKDPIQNQEVWSMDQWSILLIFLIGHMTLSVDCRSLQINKVDNHSLISSWHRLLGSGFPGSKVPRFPRFPRFQDSKVQRFSAAGGAHTHDDDKMIFDRWYIPR